MSFPTLTRQALVDELNKRGIQTKFIEPSPMDVTTHCHYFTIMDDVEAGFYTFACFIDAHAVLETNNTPYTIGEVRLLAKQSFAQAIKKQTQLLSEQHQAGILVGGGWQDGMLS